MGFSRDRVHVLLSLDTDRTNIEGFAPRANVKKGGDYPQSWWRNWGKGRVFYTSLGHLPETWTNDSAFRAHLTAASAGRSAWKTELPWRAPRLRRPRIFTRRREDTEDDTASPAAGRTLQRA